MTIEFHTQHAAVSEKLVDYIRNELMKMYHLFKEISRAEVILKEDNTIIASENKTCEIRLTVFGDDLLAYRRTEDFKKSAREVIKELKKLIKQSATKKNEPPDIMTSTVKIK
jgi:putative sigma-54 modulation protein